jgi:hypothetical protein
MFWCFYSWNMCYIIGGFYMCFILYCNGLLSKIYRSQFLKFFKLPNTEILYNIVFRNKYSFKPYIHFSSIKKNSIILIIVPQRAKHVILVWYCPSLHGYIQISTSNVYMSVFHQTNATCQFHILNIYMFGLLIFEKWVNIWEDKNNILKLHTVV